MVSRRDPHVWAALIAICATCGCGNADRASPEGAPAIRSPEETVRAAIQAHGGEERLAATRTGTATARVVIMMAPPATADATWEEHFELPRRYKRTVRGRANGKEFTMDYAVADGAGWERRNGGPATDFTPKWPPLDRAWNAALGNIPPLLTDHFRLEPGGVEHVAGREFVGVRVVGEDEIFLVYFDRQSGLLAKSRQRTLHPLRGVEVDLEVAYADYRDVSGVQYPWRITSYIDGEKVQEMTITGVELKDRIDDAVFAKP